MLKKINREVQQVAEALATTLEANVSIVDSNMLRIAATGHYRKMVGKYAPRDSVFAKVLETEKTIVLDDPGLDSYCLDCPDREKCIETYQICTPITWNGEVVGVIGIIAFNQSQKDTILVKKEHYLDFLVKMAGLFSSRVGEAVLNEELASKNEELAAVIDNVHQGVLCLDAWGGISQINVRAMQLLGFEEQPNLYLGRDLSIFWPNALLLKALEEGQDYYDTEEYIQVGQNRKGLLSTVKLIRHNGTVSGAVATFTGLVDMQRSAARASEQSDFTFENLIGSSPAFVRSKSRARHVADQDSTVLITGESGTGKELFARAIHNFSSRAEHPFLGINCSAIPESLLESEFFGYESGAFTGANKRGKPGKIELAHNGTFFLDEIGDMPLFLQAKILRVLQEKRITKVGGVKGIDVDVRIIAATNKDLRELVAKKLFREDLYYRLNVIPLELPPLRERRQDIPAFIEHFVKMYNARLNKNILGFAEEAMEILLRYPWPGNVRELENIVEYGISFAEGDYVHYEDIRDRIPLSARGEEKSLRARVAEFERRVISEHLDKYGWDDQGKQKAAEILQMSRATLYRKMSQG